MCSFDHTQLGLLPPLLGNQPPVAQGTVRR
jgi:hypothetical protein